MLTFKSAINRRMPFERSCKLISQKTTAAAGKLATEPLHCPFKFVGILNIHLWPCSSTLGVLKNLRGLNNEKQLQYLQFIQYYAYRTKKDLEKLHRR
jgi:hypothetical protein